MTLLFLTALGLDPFLQTVEVDELDPAPALARR